MVKIARIIEHVANLVVFTGPAAKHCRECSGIPGRIT
jgi:hypothetical protein